MWIVSPLSSSLSELVEDELRPILDWKYSDDPIEATYWTSKSFTDYSWPFLQTDTAEPSSITRYYRRLITIPSVKLTAGFILTFKSFGGCRVYVNGKAIHSYNLQPYAPFDWSLTYVETPPPRRTPREVRSMTDGSGMTRFEIFML